MSFFQDKIVAPLRAQLRQGTTPEKLALSVALGIVLGCFPVIGTTTALCLGAGFALKLNQPALQIVNYLVYPLQFALLIPFFRLGESLFRAEPIPLYAPDIARLFRAEPAAAFSAYGLTVFRGVFVWFLAAPAATWVLYKLALPRLRGLKA